MYMLLLTTTSASLGTAFASRTTTRIRTTPVFLR
jgi:hypothetical protein